jgi:hypothetical protein
MSSIQPVEPAPYPRTLESGGGGNCGPYSLLSQNCQFQEEHWSKYNPKEKMLELRNVVCLYAKNKIPELINSPDFCLDFFDDLQTIKAEALNPFLKNMPSVIAEGSEAKEKLALFDEYFLQKDSSNAEESSIAKAALLNCYASYIKNEGVCVDKLFWNLYTRLANDADFINDTLSASENAFPFKQVALIRKIAGIYRIIGLWPKQDSEELDLSKCAFIYYDGKGHYQSFWRNQIVDYLTSEVKSPANNSCTLF